MSDSHDDMQMIALATEEFNARGVGHVIHAGDVVSPFTFEVLRGIKAPFVGVFGNNDGDRVLLKEKSGGSLHVQPHALELGGRRMVVIHEPTAAEAMAQSGLYDVVVYGHTHIPEIRTLGKALVINPGKTARLHKGKTTVVVLDTDTMKAELVELKAKG